jgi:hypothetical protein
MDSKLRLFLRRTSPILTVMAFLAFLNLMTTSFPWALFPIAAMGIPVINIFASIFLAEDNQNPGDRDISEQMRRAKAEARREMRSQMEQVKADMRAAAQGQAVTPAAPAAPPPSSSGAGFNASLATQVAQVRTYRQAIDNLARSAPNTSRKTRLAELSSQFADWQKSVEHLADRITSFRQDAVIQNDLRTVPEAIRKLESQLSAEQDELMRAQIAKTLESRRNQLASIQKLQTSMRQAEIQLESAVAALGTVYSQALANQSTTTIADYAGLSSDVSEQVRVLQDQLEALEEVRLGQARANLSAGHRG